MLPETAAVPAEAGVLAEPPVLDIPRVDAGTDVSSIEDSPKRVGSVLFCCVACSGSCDLGFLTTPAAIFFSKNFTT